MAGNRPRQPADETCNVKSRF